MTANELIRRIDEGVSDSGMRYIDFAKLTNVTVETFYCWRQGESMKQIKELIRMADVLGLELVLKPKEQ